MSVQENIDITKRWFQQVWNEGKIETIHELFSADGVAHGHYGPRSEVRGPAEFLTFFESIRGAFSDIQVTIEDAFGAEDKVVVRWTCSMTHTGDSLGMPVSNNPVRITGITIVRIVGGKIVEGWDNWDRLGMLEQIGAVRPTENAA